MRSSAIRPARTRSDRPRVASDVALAFVAAVRLFALIPFATAASFVRLGVGSRTRAITQASSPSSCLAYCAAADIVEGKWTGEPMTVSGPKE